MAFHLGSLGFLTPFKLDTYQSQVTQIIEGECSPTWQSQSFYSIHIPLLLAKHMVCSSFYLQKKLVCVLFVCR